MHDLLQLMLKICCGTFGHRSASYFAYEMEEGAKQEAVGESCLEEAARHVFTGVGGHSH